MTSKESIASSNGVAVTLQVGVSLNFELNNYLFDYSLSVRVLQHQCL